MYKSDAHDDVTMAASFEEADIQRAAEQRALRLGYPAAGPWTVEVMTPDGNMRTVTRGQQAPMPAPGETASASASDLMLRPRPSKAVLIAAGVVGAIVIGVCVWLFAVSPYLEKERRKEERAAREAKLDDLARMTCTNLNGAMMITVGQILQGAILEAQRIGYSGPELGSRMRSMCPDIMVELDAWTAENR
jgi:hypothetical protein